jgi:hypothetical protein
VAGDHDLAVLFESDVIELPDGSYYWAATAYRDDQIRFFDGRAAHVSACNAAIDDALASWTDDQRRPASRLSS